MAKKKQNRNNLAQTLQPLQAITRLTSQDATAAADDQPFREVSKGNTADMRHMFADALGDDNEILNQFPIEWRDPVLVLKSIHGNELSLETRRTVWGKPVLAFKVAITALDDISIFVRLDVELHPGYPKIPPTIVLDELAPDTNPLRQGIKTAIAETERLNKDDEYMVSSILQNIQEKLDDVHADLQQRAQGTSLEEERATVETAALEVAAKQQKVVQDQQAQEAAAKDEKLAKDVEAHRRRRQLMSSSQSALEDSTSTGEEYPDTCVIFNRDMQLKDNSLEFDLHFRAVQSMSILYRRSEKLVSVACPFRGGKVVPVELVLKEVRLPSMMETKAEYEDTLRKVETALQEVESYDHASIVKIYGHKLLQVAATVSDPHWEIFILTEKAQQSLFALLSMAGMVNASKIRTFTRSMLDALEYYDRKGYVHPAIHAHNILLFGSETTTYSAKLSDGYGTTLRNLVEKIQKGQSPEIRQGNWAAPEVIDGSGARNNKTCIWELGVVLLQMALGNDMTSRYTSPEDALSQANFDQDFDHLVSKMCSTSARKRPTAFQLHSFQFFKSHTDSVFRSEIQLSKTANMTAKLHNSTESRWISEWEPVEKLGKGGFGTVFKARHRLDGYLYAVKQLKCRSMRDTEDIWGEVRMLAQLNHPAIVRYFLAWSEEDHDFADTDTSMTQTDPRSFSPPTASNAPRSSLFAAPSTGHDFMDPSLAQLSDVEDLDEEQDEAESSSSSGGGLFGYQSAPSDSEEEESQAVVSEDEDESADQSDPFDLQPANNNIDDAPNFFGNSEEKELRQVTNVPSRPQTFVLAKGTPSAIRRPPQYYNRSSTLYIQMELCETGTLLDLIRSGLPERIEEAWRIFRLVLDGLDYIHERGIVHRDLKPMNIFIDSQRMPKIGDFGLASASQASTDGGKIATHVAGPMSRGVGTVFYIAPELEDSKQSGKYSSKADMFALGVIFFEMCFPFKTSTERINWLRQINENTEQELPKRFEKEEYRIQGRIIKSLLSHEAERRPSAKDLILDPEVPEPLEEDKERRYFQRLVQGDPQQLQSVMKNFMARQATRAQSLAYSHYDEENTARPDAYLQFKIQQKLSEVFTSHGAVEVARSTTLPVEGLYPNAVKFLDEAGFTVQLPYDLTVPFARRIAVERPEYEKSFCFGTVFRQRKEPGTEPICMPEADYDIVSYSARDLSLKDAQAISVLDDCLTKLAPLFTRSFLVIVSHGDLLDLILRACEVPEARLDEVKRILSNLNVAKTTWKQIEPQLRSMPISLPTTTLNALHRFDFSAEIKDMRDRVLENLNKFKQVDFATRATRTLNRLQELDEYLKRMQVRVPVLYSPISNTSEFLYQGSIMFKCVEGKTSKTVFVGGRYDALIRNYQTPMHQTFARAVGFRINVVDLALYARNDALRTIGGKSNRTRTTMPTQISPRLDVVVASFDEPTLYNSCIEIVRNVLDAGFSAELAGSFSSMEELEQAYATLTRYWTVIVRPGGSKIKVRSPSKDEADVTSSELISYLKEEISDKPSINTSEPSLRRTRSSHGASERENVTILTPQHKSKKVNRAAIVDSARIAAQELAEHMSKTCRVLAIDTDDETLQKLRNTRLTDSESWRTLRHSVTLNERDYVQEIQRQLHDWCELGQDGAFVCNYKTKRCIFYDFGNS